MLVGLQGAGKTTNGAKLAGLMRKQGKRPLLVACDVYRPAAIQQLETVGRQLDIPVFQMGQGDPVAIAKAGIEHAKKYGNDLVFLDTAGRLHNKANLMNELGKISRIVDRELPDADKEVLLVLDGTTGQNGLMQAKEFKQIAGVTAIALTKLDGTAKGGIVIAVADALQIPVKFIGVGEQPDDLMPFDARAFVDALL